MDAARVSSSLLRLMAVRVNDCSKTQRQKGCHMAIFYNGRKGVFLDGSGQIFMRPLAAPGK
jgi:hypothetical protein